MPADYKEIGWKEICIFGVGGGIFVIGFLILTGTLTSGYHLVDDHEFYVIANMLKNEGFWNTLASRIASDLSIRFRPLYTAMRVIGVWLLGTETIIWSVIKALEVAAAGTCLYVFARKLSTNKIFAVMFAAVCLIGKQSAVWWRLGPQESFGILLFSLGLLATYNLGRKISIINKVVFIIILTALSLQKESFCVSLPGFFLLLMAFYMKNNYEQHKMKEVLKNYFTSYFSEIVMIAFVFLINIYIIIFYVGTDKISYAGFSDDMSFINYVACIFANLRKDCLLYLLLCAFMILIMQIEFRRNKITRVELFELLFCIYIFSVEQLAYAKSGMHERYLLPWVVSIAYFSIIIVHRIIKKNQRVKVSAYGITMIFLLYFGLNTVTDALVFTQSGKDLKECVAFVTENTSNDAKIICVSRDREIDGSFGVLMSLQYGYEDYSDLTSYEDNIKEIEQGDIIFGKSGQVYYRIEVEAGLSLDDYDFIETENYEIGIKKGSRL